MSTAIGLMSFADFERLPNPASGYYELHHGQLVFMPPRKKIHMKIQQVLLDLLSPMVAGRGFLTIEFAFRPIAEYEAWQADLGFVSQARWDQDENEYFLGAPELVIEVLSASNTMDDILERQNICLNNGCIAFWMVDPRRKIVMVTTIDRTTITYDSNRKMPLPPTIAPEAFINVATIFSE